MFADRVYDQAFFAAMADRGFYVFTSPPCQAGTSTTAAARSPSRPPQDQSARIAAADPDVAPFAEAA